MREIKAIKTGRLELIPTSSTITSENVKKKFDDQRIPVAEKEWFNNNKSEIEVLFFVCDIEKNEYLGKVVCKQDVSDCNASLITYENIDSLQIKEFCNVIHYTGEWLFKHSGKKKVLLKNDGFEKETLKRLRLLEYKPTKEEDYLVRIFKDLDPTSAIISMLSGL